MLYNNVLTVVDGGRHYIIEVQTTLDLDSAIPLLKFVLEYDISVVLLIPRNKVLFLNLCMYANMGSIGMYKHLLNYKFITQYFFHYCFTYGQHREDLNS
jgi:hypothetical protein